MPKMHLALASESVNQASPDNITWVPDDVLQLSAAADDAFIPEDLTNLILAYFGGTGMTRARLSSSFLDNGNIPRPYFIPVDTAANPGDLPPFHDFRDNPFPLHDPRSKVQGKLRAQVANGGLAQSRAVVILGDGPVKPDALKGVVPMRFTGTLTTTAAERFEGFTPVCDETLADGIWELVDARVQAATGIAWRVIPPKGLNPNPENRPGWLTQTTVAQKRGLPLGGLGPLCRFKSDALPTIQVAASTAAVQSPQGILYVRKVQ